MDFKLKYFENRNIIHSKNARSRSASYATREINTFATLLRLSKITHHLDWKGKTSRVPIDGEYTMVRSFGEEEKPIPMYLLI